MARTIFGFVAKKQQKKVLFLRNTLKFYRGQAARIACSVALLFSLISPQCAQYTYPHTNFRVKECWRAAILLFS